MFGAISSALSLASAAKNLFGKQKSERDSMEDQLAMQLSSARQMPTAQVEGLRAAGLNPMLAVGNGISAPPPISSSPGAETQASTAKALAAATASNQAAQASLYKAQADKTVAETETEQHRPMNVAADTGVKMGQKPLLEAQTRQSLAAGDLAGATKSLQEQLNKTEEWKTRTATVETFLKNFEYELSLKNLPPRQAAEIRKISAEARSAETEADLNESLRELERVAGIAGKAVGSARALLHSFKR